MPRTSRPVPQRFRNGWRIRWTDARSKRRSEIHAAEKDACFKLDAHLLEVQQVERGLALLISMLNEAHERGWLREVPRIRKFKSSRLR